MFRKDLKIGEGDKYDLSKVSKESVDLEEIAKKNAKLIDIFKKFDENGDRKLSSGEMAQALSAFDTLDKNNDDKLSKKELDAAAVAYNEELKHSGKDQFKGSDIKDFIKNLYSAVKNDPTADTQKVFAQYQKQQQIDKAARRYGLEEYYNSATEYAYHDKNTGKYYLPNEEGTEFVEVHWSDDEQRFKVMSEEELARLNAEIAAQNTPVEEALEEKPQEEQQPEVHPYIVQSDESFTQVVTKSLQAQGIENPTKEQIEAEKEQFKNDNPDAVKTLSNGYEFLHVGAKVKLRGEVEYDKNSQQAIAQWAADNPDKVWKSEEQKQQEAIQKQKEAERKEIEELAGDSTIIELEVVGDLPTEEQKARGKRAVEMGLDTSKIDGFYRKFGPDGHYEYYEWDNEKQDFVNVKEKGIISVTEPNQYTSKYILRKSAEDGGYTDVIYSPDNKPEKELKYDKNKNYTGSVTYEKKTEDGTTTFIETTYDDQNRVTKKVVKNAEGAIETTYKYTYEEGNPNPIISGGTPEERATQTKAMADSIMPDMPALTNEAGAIEDAKEIAANAKKELDEILTHDWLGDGDFRNAMKDKTKFNKDTMAYIVDGTIADRIVKMFGLDKEDVYEYILKPLQEKSRELGQNTAPDINEDSDKEEMQDAISLLSSNINVVNEDTIEAAKKINDNKEFFIKSNLSLARAVDMAENEPDSVSFGTKDDGSEYCGLEDGTEVCIKCDKEGNITSILILNSGGPDTWYDIRYNASGFVAFDPDGKCVSDTFKESILNAPFDFEKIKALAERIWAAKPEE